MKAVLLLASLWVLLACKTDEPQITLLLGRWQFVEATSSYDKYNQKANPQYPAYIAFTGNGLAGEVPESYPIEGGWCNPAKKYIYVNNTLSFIFSEAQCIPFVPQKRSANAKVIGLTRDTLIIEWQYTTFRYKRA